MEIMHDARRKLTGTQTEEIRLSKYRTSALARLYGVTPARIAQIRNGRDRSNEQRRGLETVGLYNGPRAHEDQS